jgi:hypothetical protein
MSNAKGDISDDALRSYAYSTTIDTGTRSIRALQASGNLTKGCSGEISSWRGGRRNGGRGSDRQGHSLGRLRTGDHSSVIERSAMYYSKSGIMPSPIRWMTRLYIGRSLNVLESIRPLPLLRPRPIYQTIQQSSPAMPRLMLTPKQSLPSISTLDSDDFHVSSMIHSATASSSSSISLCDVVVCGPASNTDPSAISTTAAMTFKP